MILRTFKEEIKNIILNQYGTLEEIILSYKDDENLGSQLKSFMLQMVDSHWIKHIDLMSQVKDGIHLRSYAQEDPYRLFESEAFAEFKHLIFEIESGVSARFLEYIRNQENSELEITEDDVSYGVI